jgi:DNA-directed RNA polymerase sigma subunit (sigma70/sigma32)
VTRRRYRLAKDPHVPEVVLEAFEWSASNLTDVEDEIIRLHMFSEGAPRTSDEIAELVNLPSQIVDDIIENALSKLKGRSG